MDKIRFSPEAQELIKQGLARLMETNDGQIKPILIDSVTGKIIEIGHIIIDDGLIDPLSIVNPLGSLPNILTTGAQMYQNHRGFQQTFAMITALQKNIQIL